MDVAIRLPDGLVAIKGSIDAKSGRDQSRRVHQAAWQKFNRRGPNVYGADKASHHEWLQLTVSTGSGDFEPLVGANIRDSLTVKSAIPKPEALRLVSRPPRACVEWRASGGQLSDCSREPSLGRVGLQG